MKKSNKEKSFIEKILYSISKDNKFVNKPIYDMADVDEILDKFSGVSAVSYFFYNIDDLKGKEISKITINKAMRFCNNNSYSFDFDEEITNKSRVNKLINISNMMIGDKCNLIKELESLENERTIAKFTVSMPKDDNDLVKLLLELGFFRVNLL